MAIVGLHPILNKLEKPEFDFHLVGSRYLGTDHDKSDYDFMCKVKGYTPDLRALISFLEKLGFVAQREGGYCKDTNLIAIYKWTPSTDKYTTKADIPRSIDILIASSEEFDRRMNTFKYLKEAIHPNGKGDAYTHPNQNFVALTKAIKGNTNAWQALYNLTGQIIKANNTTDVDDALNDLTSKKKSKGDYSFDDEDEDDFNFPPPIAKVAEPVYAKSEYDF